MISQPWRRFLASIMLCLVLFVSACTPEPPSRYDQVQQETTQRGAQSAVVKDATQGSNFNRFFPKSGNGYQVVAAQEKKGFAEYKINKDGKNVAVISITDTTSVPAAAAKYKDSTFNIGGYPAVDQGANNTGVLVDDRYQVKISSRDASFTKDDRVAWLQKVNLNGLAKLN